MSIAARSWYVKRTPYVAARFLLRNDRAMCNAPPMSPPNDFIGSRVACTILDRDRSSLIRYVRDQRLTPIAKNPGDNGAYTFRRADVEALAAELNQVAA